MTLARPLNGFGPRPTRAYRRQREISEGEAIDRLSQLTIQQARILSLVCDGKLNKQIAHELSIAETTVKAHMTAILRKLVREIDTRLLY